MQMPLELAIGSEAQSLNDTNDRRGIRVQTLGHSADAEQYKLARVLQDGPDDLLALGAEAFDGFFQIALHLRCGFFGHVGENERNNCERNRPRPQIERSVAWLFTSKLFL